MLRKAIERCPPKEWVSTDHKNAFWQVSYHALFFAHLYLQRDEAAFRLWEQHRGEGDGIEGEPYTQAQVLHDPDAVARANAAGLMDAAQELVIEPSDAPRGPVAGGLVREALVGRWMLTDATGTMEPTATALDDGRLTIQLEGRRLTFTRAAGG